ncbi:hypothetical protein BH10ACI1_BH10ACI1_14980 [soil metagenome]
MRFTTRLLGVLLLLLPLFLTNTTNAFGFENDDEYTPQVTARVARITFLKGDVQIKRAGNESWEIAAQNLPLGEGDEITTSDEARIEIQFDSYNHLRLSENSYLKLTTLRDDGIAVSLPQGTLILRVSEFDKDKSFFEIDAPKTTLAVQQTGMYRVDAGDSKSTEVRVTATEKGEARIYSGNSGFTLKNGRSTRIFLTGNLAGEWETADASRFADEFDSWALERDTVIAKRLRDSYYDKYYDRDIDGADDLNDYGQWIYTRSYGYVWKPYSSSVSNYSNWSPYRYGHWRWFPPYGWTWVNDESWGWATYHYGRWVYDNGGWLWSPYGSRRWRRSWWSPALVVITYSGGYICWYPLPYQYNYYNYNAYYYNTTIINNNTTVVVVNPTPTPNISPTPVQNIAKQQTNQTDIPPSQIVPQTGVVAINANEFGRDRTGIQTAPANITKQILVKVPAESQTTPILPNYNQLNGKISKTIVAQTPPIVQTQTPVKTGVIDRQVGVSVSDRIQKERVLDNRTIDRTNTTVRGDSTTTVRDTGAVTRTEQQTVRQNPTTTQTQNQTDRNTTRNTTNTDNTIRSTGGGNTTQTDRNTTRNNSTNNDTQQTDRNTQRNQQQTDRNQNPPVRNQQQQQENQTQRNQTQRTESQPTQRTEQPTRQPQQQQQQQKKEEQKPQQQQ